MPDLRAHKSIGERNDFRWFRRAMPLRVYYGRLSLLCMLVAGAAIIVPLLTKDDRAYWSAPVSQAHASFEKDCRACHVQRGAPLVRLAKFDETHFSVRDADCQTCHKNQSDDHSTRMIAGAEQGCVACHREHQGKTELADVADQHCLACHSSLQVKDGSPDHEHVVSFAKHPEFLPWRSTLAAESLERRAAAHPLAVEVKEDHWQDRTKLRFNHAKHLVAHGVLTAPPTVRTPADLAAHVDRQVLDCRDCHQIDAAGQYMQPIQYEQHCSACHKLEPSSKLALKDPLPHEKPELVLGQLRERLMQFVEAKASASDKTEPPLLPNKQPPASKQKWEAVEALVQAEREHLFGSLERGCTYCHQRAPGEAFDIVPPNIPNRWFPGSRFDHRQHAELSCIACHGEPGKTAAGFETQLASSATSDILMPKVETCQACHGAAPAKERLSVRAHCIDCHDYHGEHGQGSGKLDRWLPK